MSPDARRSAAANALNMTNPPTWLSSILGALTLIACAENADRPPVATGPNVLLVTLDTTRADRIGCYGYETAQTPAIDSIAERGLLFENAYCQVPLTLPSHVSLLTGTYPAVNGIRINGGGVVTEATPSLALVLQRRGYRTGAFTSVVVLHNTYGLDQGFDVYDDVYEGATLRSSGRTTSMRLANETCDRAIAWLENGDDTPFFMWLHFFDPHLPLNPPPPFDEALEDPYDGEIAFCDAQIGRVLEWLERAQKLDDTLVIITSDHGEALGDHGEDEHGLFLYSSTTRVPLVMAGPGLPGQPTAVTGAVSLVSLMPTLLDCLEVGVDFDMNGESFADAWQSEDWSGEAVFSETEYPRLGYGWASLRSMTTADWLYVSGPVPELYDRETDASETVDVIAAHPDVAARFAKELAELEDSMTPRVDPARELTSEERRALESLGYVHASNRVDSPSSGRNPKDMVEVSNGYLQALMVARSGDHAAAAELFEQLLTLSPESDAIHGSLGNSYLKLRRYEDARREYELSLRSNPHDAMALFGVGESHFATGDAAKAKTAFELCLEQEPEFGQALGRLGIIAARAGETAKAVGYFRDFARVDPESVSAHTNLGNALMKQGRFDEGVTHIHRAIEIEPGNIRAHLTLWNAVRDKAVPRSVAVKALRDSLDKRPGNLELQARLAWVLASDARASRNQLEEALLLAQGMQQKATTSWRAHDVLALTLAAQGNFNAAKREAEIALDLARRQKSPAAGAIDSRLQLYSAGKRFIE